MASLSINNPFKHTTMITKTYGVEGFTDWQCAISVGKAKVSVHFSGGTMTRYGVTPAEYTTSSPFVQKVIEGSVYFTEGRIKLLRTNGVTATIKKKSVKVTDTDDANAKTAEQAEAETSTDESEFTEVEVACLSDAAMYLREQFGIPTSKIRSRDKANAYGRENGVKFIGLD